MNGRDFTNCSKRDSVHFAIFLRNQGLDIITQRGLRVERICVLNLYRFAHAMV